MATSLTIGRYLALRAGPLTMWFDCQTAGLRTIQWGDMCVWRELVVLVRDHNWQTIPATIQILKKEITNEAFKLHIAATHLHNDIHFQWSGFISGDRTGVINYTFEGKAVCSFLANRIGLCLLHPCLECAGKPIRQTRSDGSTVLGQFPMLVEPQILGRFAICDLVGLAHQLRDDVWADARFEGDIFETEDQRNWTDASFKTYCPPLERPIPKNYQPDETEKQSVWLQMQFKQDVIDKCDQESVNVTNICASAKANNAAVHFVRALQSDEANSQCMPQFGFCLNENAHHSPKMVAELCKLLCADHLRWDLRVSTGRFIGSDSAHQLASSVKCAAASNCELELSLHLPREGMFDVEGLADELRRQQKHLKRLVVYRQGIHVTAPTDLAALRQALPNSRMPIGGGSDANFCEWNREHSLGRFPMELADFLCWSINPQVHASDDLSLMETIQSLPSLVDTAKKRTDGAPLAVSPITLRPRFNAVASDTANNSFASPSGDPRQRQPIGAAWSIATWHALATAGVESMTWFEAYGPGGFGDERNDRSSNCAEHALELYPIGNCFKDLLQIKPQTIQRAASSTSLSAVVLQNATAAYLSIVNLCGEDITVSLNLETIWPAKHNPLTKISLVPYDVQLIKLARFR